MVQCIRHRIEECYQDPGTVVLHKVALFLLSSYSVINNEQNKHTDSSYGLDCLMLVSDVFSSYCSFLIFFVLNYENYILFCV